MYDNLGSGIAKPRGGNLRRLAEVAGETTAHFVAVAPLIMSMKHRHASRRTCHTPPRRYFRDVCEFRTTASGPRVARASTAYYLYTTLKIGQGWPRRGEIVRKRGIYRIAWSLRTINNSGLSAAFDYLCSRPGYGDTETRACVIHSCASLSLSLAKSMTSLRVYGAFRIYTRTRVGAYSV